MESETKVKISEKIGEAIFTALCQLKEDPEVGPIVKDAFMFCRVTLGKATAWGESDLGPDAESIRRKYTHGEEWRLFNFLVQTIRSLVKISEEENLRLVK